MPGRKSWIAWGLALALSLSLARPVIAASEQVPVGPRALAMGGAFSSIADDASALYWNPAGISWIGHQEITGSYANLFQSNIKDNHVAFVLPLAARQAAGFDWYHSGFDDAELGFSENRFDLSFSTRWRSLVSLGASVKYLTRSTSLDGSELKRGTGVGVDVGALATPLPGLRLALVAQDLFDTDLSYSDGSGAAVYPRNLRAGASYSFHRFGTVAVDLDDRLHVGIEGRPHPALAIRAGLERDLKDPEEPTLAAGLGFKWNIFRADYAYVMPPSLPSTSYFGLSLAFNFNPSMIRIEDVKSDEVFASLYKRYDDHAIASVDLKNLSDRDVDATVSVFVPGLMDRPSTQEVSLRPGVVNPRRLSAVLSDRTMRMTEDRWFPLEVQVRYRSLRLDRSEKSTRKIKVYAPGAIRWDDGVAPAAAFITPRDPMVESLARQVASTVRADATGLLRNENIARAAALCAAVSMIGVRYVPDPVTPYASTASHEKSVDTIYYPRQTLEKRAGDCDDLTVLLASLLGNVGIATQLVDVPGHVFLMFDSGLHPSRRAGLGLPETMSTVEDGRLWIPLEATALDRGFSVAWEAGASQIASSRSAQPSRALFVDVERAQAEYEPSDLPGDNTALVLDAGRLAALMGSERAALAGMQGDFVRDLRADLGDHPGDAALRLNLAAEAFFLAGRYPEALARLLEADSIGTRPAMVSNNRGDVLVAMGQPDLARKAFQSAQAADPDDAGVLLNLGLLAFAIGDSAASEEWFARGIGAAGSEPAAAGLLGLAGEATDLDPTSREDAKRLTPEMIRAALKRAARRVPASISEPGRPGVPRPGASGERPVVVTRIGAIRANELQEASRYLYWKR